MALRLLIVDDHELVRMGMRLLFASHPEWEICGEASNGHEAIAKVQELRPDVIILDLSMGGMKGFEAAGKIRQIVPAAKLIFYSMFDLGASAKKAGADEFVFKSDSPKELLAAIERAAKTLRDSQKIK